MSAIVHGDSKSVQLITDATIGRIFDATCRAQGLREAVVFCGAEPQSEHVQLTFTQLRSKVDQLSAGLVRSCPELKPGDVVALWGANHLNHVLSVLACAKAGFVVSGIPHSASEETLVAHLNAVDAKTVICFPTIKSGHCYEMMKKIDPSITTSNTLLQCKVVPSLRHVIIDEGEEKYKGTISMAEIFASGLKDKSSTEKLLAEYEAKIKPNSIAAIQATGSIETPKYVALSHFQLINSCLVACNRLGLSKMDEILCCQMPIFRGPIMCFAVLATCVVGTKVVYPSTVSTAPAILTAIQEQKCTSLLTNPIAFHLMLRMQVAQQYSLESISSLCLIGDHTTAEHAAVFSEKLPNLKHVMSAVILTEVGCFPFMYPKCTPAADIGKYDGKIVDHFSAKVVSFDGEEVFDQPGRLYIKLIGDSDFLGYYKQPRLSKEYFTPDGWLKTGDVAKLSKDGFIVLMGSDKDLVLRNGKTIVPYFLEKLLSNHEDVFGCQIVGVEDKKLGEKVSACILKKKNSSLTDTQLEQAFVKMCSAEKIEKPDAFVFLQDFPRTQAKKINKSKLKLIAAAKLL